MKWSALLVIALVLSAAMFGVVRADDDDSPSDPTPGEVASAPFLLVEKHLSSTEATPGDDITVTITVINVGRSPAFGVLLDDNTWGHGIKYTAAPSTSASLGIIAPGATGNHTYTITFAETGAVFSDAAKVRYTTDATQQDKPFTALSSRAHEELEGQGVDKRPYVHILTPSEYERRHTRQVKEWTIFLVLLVVPLGLPLYLYKTRSSELEGKEREGRNKRKQ